MPFISVLKDPVKARTLSSAGELAWSGAASTAFWVDPAGEPTAMFFSQLPPSSTHPSASIFVSSSTKRSWLIRLIADHSERAGGHDEGHSRLPG